MNRRQFLGYGVSAGVGVAAGIYVPRVFQSRKAREEDLLEDLRISFRVTIYSEEWLREKEGQAKADATKLLLGLSPIEFCYSSSHFPTAELRIGEEVIIGDISSGSKYERISTREIGEVKYTLVLRNSKKNHEITLPVSFRDNMELMAAVSDAEKNGPNDKVLLEDYSAGYPRRALIDRKKQVEYQINGLEAIAEATPENLKEYFQRINDFKSYDDFLTIRRREETIEEYNPKPQQSSNPRKS